jgi:hypothetical protein
MIPVKLISSITVAVMATLAAPAALASDIRPTGYLERGTMQPTQEGTAFVPDSAAEANGGRYMRVGGFDELVFYGVGSHPNLDWLWPNHRATPHLKELLRASPGSLSHLERYEAGQEYAQNWARMGMIIALGASLAAAGGYVYGALPSNPREMAPGFYYATGGVAALGALIFGTSTFIANDNQQILDRAIASYNRDMAGRRKTQQPTLVP